MSRDRTSWQRVSRHRPCPVCGKPDWCLVSGDGAAAICPRIETGSVKPCGEAGWLHWLDGPPRAELPPLPPPPRSRRDFGAFIRFLQQFADQPLRDLGRELGVSSEALRQLGVGWHPGGGWWGFPERDGQRNVIGILRRTREGTKTRLSGSRSGLSYAADWEQGDGPILLVEGPTDAAAVMTLGLSAIGRPSNRGGGAYLADLLQSVSLERDLIVLGDNDAKEDGRWPGREGAIDTATELARRLSRPVDWALTPDRVKDVRNWLRRFPNTPPRTLATAFLEGLARETVAPPPVLRPTGPRGPRIELSDYRDRMNAARLKSLDRPGIYLDRSPTGSGKSRVDRDVILSMISGGVV
ncbi:MAG: hypothetical protein KDA75_06225 [Planctomycetaceae bacterium]|nr:hypothetical protein [Planctomycetaceae bacterium]